jgi:methylated-DNA-protein-cysteine methyltransferase-like protein
LSEKVSLPIEDQNASAFDCFCLVLSQIPQGKVCSYGRLAELASLGNARQTCRYLKLLPKNSTLPWYRVVTAKGKLAEFTNANKQKRLLESEGVIFSEKGIIAKRFYM